MTVFGYGFASEGQSLAVQLEQLHASGCMKIYLEKTGEVRGNCPQLTAFLDAVREGDRVVFYDWGRITGNIQQQILALLRMRNVAFRDLTCFKANQLGCKTLAE